MEEERYTILVAEDDGDIRSLLRLYLENSGYRAILAEDGLKALEMVKTEHVDLALLDIMLPGANGYRLLEEIRKLSNIPVLFLTAKDQDYDKILGLNLGADAYLTKPFNPLEVVAHVQSHLRRFYKLGAGIVRGSSVLSVGELKLDLERMKLEKNGKAIDLTPMELKILSCLMQSPGRVFTKGQLYDSINGGYSESDDKTMMVHISNLREKLEDDVKEPKYIKTVRGLGYKIDYRE